MRIVESSSRTLADAIDEIGIATEQAANRDRARRLAETTAKRWTHAAPALLHEIHVAARNAVEDGARVLAFTATRRVEAHVLDEIVLQILIADLRHGRLEDQIDLHALERRAASLTFGSANRTNAAPASLDEVHVAARKLLVDPTRALAVGPAIVGARGAAHGKRERDAGEHETDVAGKSSRVERANDLQGNLRSARAASLPQEYEESGSRQWSLLPAHCLQLFALNVARSSFRLETSSFR